MIRTAAKAAFAEWEQKEAARLAQEQADFVAAARLLVERTFTSDGKVPVKGADLTVEHVDMANRLVVVSDSGKKPAVVTYLAVFPDRVLLSGFDDGWTFGPKVESLAELGEALGVS